MARYIWILHKDPRNVIFTNIKLHFRSDNIYRIEDDEINLGWNEKNEKEKIKLAFYDNLEFI